MTSTAPEVTAAQADTRTEHRTGRARRASLVMLALIGAVGVIVGPVGPVGMSLRGVGQVPL